MDIIWSEQKLLKLLKNFYTIINVRVGFYDLTGKEIFAFPSYRSDFCNIIRSRPKGDAECVMCDRNAFRYVSKHQDVYMYHCHAGLAEMIAPIMGKDSNSNDEPVAYLMVGQIRETTEIRHHEKVKEKAGRLHLAETALTDASKRLTVLRAGELQACGNILQALASYIWLDHFVRVQNEPLSFKLKEYISANIDKELSLALLGKKLGVGRTCLCTICKRDFGMTVNELIRTTRIEHAKKLLQAGNEAISAIAKRVGIFDYNYFSKVFKTETGLAPSTFRRLCEDDHMYQAGNIS